MEFQQLFASLFQLGSFFNGVEIEADQRAHRVLDLAR